MDCRKTAKLRSLYFRPVAVLGLLCALALSLGATPKVQHVFIISIDGGKPEVIEQSQMPVLKELAAWGACTWTGRTVYPSITLPSHTSMLTGVWPEKHKISWNRWKPRAGVVRVPTVFAQAKLAGLSTAMFVGKEKFRHLVQPGTVDEFDYDLAEAIEVTTSVVGQWIPMKSKTVPARIVAKRATAYILAHQPNLCFIHFTDPDDAGHRYGWGSLQQVRALADVDLALAEVLRAIEAAGLIQDSVLLITADHGGHRQTHGSKRPEDMTIPWIAWGAGVKPHYPIDAPVNTCDTAATALWLLDAPGPSLIDGQPVTSAFTWPNLSGTTPLRLPALVHETPSKGS